jgi:DnaJ-class molecular chaperone
MTPHELLAAGATATATWWLWHAYWHPFKPCPRCQGKGINRGSTRRRFGNCKRCRGSKHVRRIGSKTVHRAVLSIRGIRKDKRDV